jgi:hypothetical protein
MQWKAKANEFNDGGPAGGQVITGMLGSDIMINFAALEIGCIDFSPDVAVRDFWVKYGAANAEADLNTNWLAGGQLAVRMEVHGAMSGRRMLTATGKLTTDALDALHTLYLAAPQSSEGLLPIVKLGSRDATNPRHPADKMYAPTFDIVGWAANPWVARAAATVTTAGAPVMRSVPVDSTITRMTVAELAASFEPGATVAGDAQEPIRNPNSIIEQMRAKPGLSLKEVMAGD